MNIIDAYHAYSFKVIEEDPILSQYEHDLEERQSYINTILLSTSVFTKLLHPIRLIRTKSEAKRITNIKVGYNRLKYSSILEHFDEEDGELEHDLRSAAEYFKPAHMKQYVKTYPVYDKNQKKLLK